MRNFLFSILLIFVQPSWAKYIQSPVNDFRLTSLQVADEQGKVESLETILKSSGKNTVFVPAYFSCNSTCPLLAENLRDSIQRSKDGKNSAVVFLSFNPKDGVSDIEMFQHHHKLPAEWRLLVGIDESATRDFLAKLGYQFQKTNDGYDHPNSAFVLSAKNQLWTGALVGNDNSYSDIDQALGEANYAELSGPIQTLVQYLSKPEYLIVIGFIGVVIPLLIILFVLFRKKKPTAEVMNV